jgi:hypothetical protein
MEHEMKQEGRMMKEEAVAKTERKSDEGPSLLPS